MTTETFLSLRLTAHRMSVTPLGEHQKIVLQVSGLCYLLGNLSNNDTEDNAYQKINLYRTGPQFVQL